jgi:hypothetical protein
MDIRAERDRTPNVIAPNVIVPNVIVPNVIQMSLSLSKVGV